MAELPVGDDWKEGNENDMCVMANCYCINCEGSNGTTTMLPTKVPYFREIIIMSFVCNDCYFRNSEINFGGEIQTKGEKLVFVVTTADDLNRQIIKSDSATVYIQECDLEIPPTTQRGNISTIEGFLRSAANNLEALQPERLKLKDLDNFYRCRAVITKLRKFAGCKDEDDDEDEVEGEDANEKKVNEQEFVPFTIIMDDPAGNSFIENPFAPAADPNLQSIRYSRTPTQDMALGLQPSAQAVEEGKIDDTNPAHKNIANMGPQAAAVEINEQLLSTKKTAGMTTALSTVNPNTVDDETLGIGRKEVIMFETPCPHCFVTAETNMCVVDLPHFKEVIIMSLFCEKCGYKSNEVKGGGGIPKYGTKITLKVTNGDDLAREVLKSDTAGIEIPELDLRSEEGGLDGVYTTIEGLLQKLYDRLTSANPFSIGDSATKQHLSNDKGNEFSEPAPSHLKYKQFLQTLQDMSQGNYYPFTVVIHDPLSNSFIGPIAKDAIALSIQAEKDGHNQCYEDYVDPNMTVTEFTRTFEQDEILGLNDMKTENYDRTTEERSQYYGTDTMEELPDRIRRVDIRGPDHPHAVGKAPVENDTTVMGPGSLNFAVPTIAQRGTKAVTQDSTASSSNDESLQQLLAAAEKEDPAFRLKADDSTIPEGMVLKTGQQGLGYYTDVPLLKRWTQRQQENIN